MKLFSRREKNPRTGQPRSSTYGKDVELPKGSTLRQSLRKAHEGVQLLKDRGLIGKRSAGGKR